MLQKALIGAIGLSAQEVIMTLQPDTINEGLGLISQIIVLIATLIGLFKKSRKDGI